MGNRAGDYVVKLKGGMDLGESGLVRELIGSRLARYFEIPTPETSVVAIDDDFAELVAAREPGKAEIVRKSIGENFGSCQLNDVAAWPIDKALPDAMMQGAATIFAFDAFIQNPDRRFNNQNLLTRGNSIFVFDHELAFSFLLDILPSKTPWKVSGEPYLKDHVFYQPLKKKAIDISLFTQRVAALTADQLGLILNDLPVAWNNIGIDKIERHVQVIGEHAEEFAEEVRRRLA